MIPLVVAWFWECGSSEMTSFCAAHLSVTACAGAVHRAAASAAATNRLSRMGLLLGRIYNTPSGDRTWREKADAAGASPARCLRQRRLPGQALRRAAALEGRHAGG